VADIMAHGEIVRLLQRYNGAFGEFRRMWDNVQRACGFTPAHAPPPWLEPGTLSYDAWFEVRKLELILRQRRAALGMPDSGGGGHLTATAEARLRADTAFIEHELALHRDVLHAAIDERSEGVIRSRMDTTAAALRAGYPDPAAHGHDPELYWYIRSSGDLEYQIQRRHDAPEDTPVLRVARDGDGFTLEAGTPSRGERATAMVAGWEPTIQEAYEALRTTHADDATRVVPLQGVAATQRTIGQLRPTIAREIENIVFEALPDTLSVAERRRQAREAGRAVAEHRITVVRGTDQLRAYDYRGVWEDANGAATGDLHHLIPLQLGGDHTRLIDVSPELHDQLHSLIDRITFDGDGTTLAPSDIRRADLNFAEGAAVLHADGTVTLYRWSGGRMVVVRAAGRGRRGG
jgi:hypothetical protein